MFDFAPFLEVVIKTKELLGEQSVQHVLALAGSAAAGEAGKQAFLASAKGVKKQLGLVMTCVKASFGVDAARQLETVTPENRQAVQQALTQIAVAQPQPVSEADLEQLQEEIEALREETEKLSRLMPVNQVQVNPVHHGTGDITTITSVNGDAFGGDKVMGDKIVGNP